VLLDRDGPADGSAAVGRLADARSLLDEGDAADPSLRLELRLLLARGRFVTHDVEGAVSDLQALLEEARAAAHRELEWRTLAALAQLQVAQGADFAARRHDQAAMEVLEGIVLALPRALREPFWRDPERRALRLRASASTDRFFTSREDAPGPEPSALEGRVGRLLDLLKRLASEHELDRLLERITDAAVELSGAERGFVLLPDDAGELEPRLVRAAGTAPDDPSVAFSRSIAEAVLIDGEPILTVDARDDRRLNEYLSVHQLSLKSVACLPIRGRSGAVGVLYLEHRMRRGRFSEADLDLLLAFADQAAIALENARLVGELAERKAALEEANEELEAAKAEIERVLVARTGELEETKRELDRTRGELRSRHERSGIIGRSEPMRKVFAVLDRVAETDVPVVIQGESGTGKELVARAIHYGGPRRKAPFVALNCAAIPEALLESELFGHVRGAFTGADRDRKGVLVRSSGGTLFLDEVGDMPAKMQVDLLRVLQEKVVRPIGGEEEEAVDVRIVSASNKSLRDLVAKGEFREDLYYRLNVVELRLPPLRERQGDVPLLVDHFLTRIAEQEGQPRKHLSREALLRLARHPLPGNVRQLEHLLLNACVMSEGDTIGAEDLALGEDTAANDLVEVPSLPEPAPVGGRPPAQSLEDFKESEKQRILRALEENGWNRAAAARELGIPRRTFYRRLKEYEIL
ncbi:MAG TPA: sigma-54-dependent Fis family transcriptional regulator, partial [Polyangiaceae bacterium LLY-WYZ-15_(1-7)]|nr:sigma-54-dependent Fis family transcriptional regulator [Polyangiaceae bacterium LLY-WYZ-15_(1-7)]